jgi:hypothetical protein
MTNAQKQKVKLGTIQCTGFKIGKDLSFSWYDNTRRH